MKFVPAKSSNDSLINIEHTIWLEILAVINKLGGFNIGGMHMLY